MGLQGVGSGAPDCRDQAFEDAGVPAHGDDAAPEMLDGVDAGEQAPVIVAQSHRFDRAPGIAVRQRHDFQSRQLQGPGATFAQEGR